MTKPTSSKNSKVLTIIGIVLCVILVPMLIINCTLIVKSFINKDEVPDFGGLFPMIVLTDSMFPQIKSGDLIFCRTIDAQKVEVGDVISFFDPSGNGSSVVTHEVIEIIGEGSTVSFRTKGINNNTEDKVLVPTANLVGKYTGFRIPAAGKVALFMQTTYGLILCVLVPVLLFVGGDVISRRKGEKAKDDDVAALLAELEELKRMQKSTGEETQNAEGSEMHNAQCT
ncbi:MAG: signal peptidase I, partial [Clostridia bacterium]|nr:signal peptidase I [Clostridia bacterium]